MSAVLDQHGHEHHDHHPTGLKRYLTSTNHKDFGTMYLWFSFAMFLVGGTMLVHGIPGGEHLMGTALSALGANAVVQAVAGAAIQFGVGLVAGAASLPVAKVVIPAYKKTAAWTRKLFGKTSEPQPQQPQLPPAPEPAPKPLPPRGSAGAALKAAVAPANDAQATPALAPQAKPANTAKPPQP